MLEVQEREGKVIFEVRVQPSASRSEIWGVHGSALKIRLQARRRKTKRTKRWSNCWRRF